LQIVAGPAIPDICWADWGDNELVCALWHFIVTVLIKCCCNLHTWIGQFATFSKKSFASCAIPLALLAIKMQ
jgi:hypothetical protein